MCENDFSPDKLNSDPAELQAALRLSEQVDRMIAGQPANLTDPQLAIAAQLLQINHVLPPADPAFEQQILAPLTDRRNKLENPMGVQGLIARLRLRTLPLAAAMAGTALILMLTVRDDRAMARLAAIFQLNSVKVGINIATATPTNPHQIVTPRVEKPLASLEMVHQVAPIPILAPGNLPGDWSLATITAVYYPDLPANVPLNIVLTYETAAGASLRIIEYFIQLGDDLTIDSLTRIDDTSTSAREIMVEGRRAILIESTPARDIRILIWQLDDILLEIEARNISTEELLTLAGSIGPFQHMDSP